MGEESQAQATSLWVATAEGTGYAPLDADVEVDIAVIGGGVAGLTAALALKRAGQSVAVLETARVGTGVTGHTTGKVTSLHRLVYTELAGRHGPDTARIYGQANQALRYLQGLARAVHGGGSLVFEDSRVLAIRDGSPVVVETGRGAVRARDVIVATNVPFGDEGSFAGRCLLHRSYIVASRAGSPPLEGTYISVEEPMRSILGVNIDGAGYVLAGGEGHRAEESGDTAERYRRLAAFNRDRLGTGEPVFRWSTQDGIPVDGLPYVGLMSLVSRRVHVITGLRKWGLTNGTAAALILADTLCGQPNPWARVFDSTRKPQPQGTPTASEGDPVPPQPLQAATDQKGKNAPAVPAPGEGVVIEQEGEKIAVYADPAGKIRSVSAICTHLGCTVEFNAADVTWDCPCHGSRFATDGTVIQGPASISLASRDSPSRAE